MNATAIITKAIPDEDDLIETALKQSLRRWTAGLLVSGSLAAISGLTGLGIGLISLIGLANADARLGETGTVCFVLAFPLSFLAAHCVDKIDETDKRIRLEYCRRHGMKDSDC